MDFSVSADPKGHLKETKKKDKYGDIAREFRKLWNMKVAVTLIGNDALGTVTKWLEKVLTNLEIRG